MAAGTRHYVQQCWPGRTRPSKPRNAGKRPSRWSYDTTDLQRESGSATLDATRGSARRAGIDLANPYHVTGFMLWMRRKELRYYGANPASAIAELALLDELSAAGWPLATQRSFKPSPLRDLARRCGTRSEAIRGGAARVRDR